MMVVSAKSVVCLCFLFSVCHVRGAYISPKMNRTILNLLKHYKISKEEKYNGQLVFSKESIPEKLVEKRVFMRGVLETYETLINQMLKELPTPLPQTTGSKGGVGEGGAGEDVRTELNYILKMVLKLKTSHYKEQDNLLSSLNKLIGIKKDNFTVQSKALGELPWLYEEASDLNNEIQSRRRRRQARRFKPHRG
ncbi:Interferon gamma [Dissostichus eleginoides]|uniref:Interferon gamma n=1 Tax=Dissostichus eleginoides TaxID=100907 RepID=A0AAD9CRH9_DISEL|nr:Interferon gamma [Dissostichus eleginoides]